MAFVPISTDQTTQIQPSSGDEIVILPGVNVVVDNSAVESSFHSATNVTLTVLGSVVSSVVGVRFLAAGMGNLGDYELYIGPEGSVIGASDFFVAVAFNGTGNTFYNAGYVSGTVISNDDAFRGTNTGIMENFEPINAALWIDGINGGSSFSNSGTISAAQTGVLLSSGGTTSFFNSGTIQSVGVSIEGSGGVQVVNNSGTISSLEASALSLGDGADIVRNSGTIFGDAVLAEGDDSFASYLNGFVAGTVSGGTGNDTLIGGNASDVLDGGADADFMRGRVGDDTLIGGSENDRLYGEEGNDRLQGDAGNDTIFGGAGEDVIVGGNGLDVLFGGADADTFVYNTFADSQEGGLFDRIRDFTPGEDKINLSSVAAGIDFVANFTGTGPEVRAFLTSAGLQLVQVDYNGDGVADMRIALLGTTELVTESDFIL